MSRSPTFRSPLASPAVANRLLVAEAIWELWRGWLAIKRRPFSQIVAADRSALGSAGGADPRRVARSVEIARRKVPWRAKCFESALALRAMLRRRGIACVLHYGIGRGQAADLRAHVWLSVADEVLIGGAEAGEFVEVADFPSEAVA
jgi:hypothetical protein